MPTPGAACGVPPGVTRRLRLARTGSEPAATWPSVPARDRRDSAPQLPAVGRRPLASCRSPAPPALGTSSGDDGFPVDFRIGNPDRGFGSDAPAATCRRCRRDRRPYYRRKPARRRAGRGSVHGQGRRRSSGRRGGIRATRPRRTSGHHASSVGARRFDAVPEDGTDRRHRPPVLGAGDVAGSFPVHPGRRDRKYARMIGPQTATPSSVKRW